jgi:DNA-binding response OmpR family regulator
VSEKTVKRIHVVDDEPDILEVLQLLLCEEGYEVVTSERGDFLDHLDCSRLPDLILLDVLLSGRDGREIVKVLKSQQKTRHIPVLMFSALPSAEETVLQAGADAFVEKPFQIEALLELIASLL